MPTGKQIEPQPESPSPVSVAFTQDAKDFQSPNHIFNLDGAFLPTPDSVPFKN